MILRVPLALLLLAVSCSRDPAPASDPQVLTAVAAALDKRVAALHDFALEGTATAASGEKVDFTYAWAQPQYAKAVVGATRIVFDGDALVMIDDEHKTFSRVDKSAGEEALLLALHQAFADFAVEGWRPPLLKKNGTTAVREGDRFVLRMALDDVALKEERL